MNKFISTKGLKQTQFFDITELESACCKEEKLCLKLNYDMLQERSEEERNDYFCYEDNLLIGYLGLYAFGRHPKQIEITGMVHPEFRRQGIFRTLFQFALEECISRGIKKQLLITERNSLAGCNFALSTGGHYAFSEYRMFFGETDIKKSADCGLEIRKAEPKDRARLTELDKVCFGQTIEESDNRDTAEKGRAIYLAKLEGKIIGKIGICTEGEVGYIFGVCIDPAFRGKGYGKDMLEHMLMKLMELGYQKIILEVETNNEQAVNLYMSCGFAVTTVFDYYELLLLNKPLP